MMTTDLRKIYTALNAAEAEQALIEFMDDADQGLEGCS